MTKFQIRLSLKPIFFSSFTLNESDWKEQNKATFYSDCDWTHEETPAVHSLMSVEQEKLS